MEELPKEYSFKGQVHSLFNLPLEDVSEYLIIHQYKLNSSEIEKIYLYTVRTEDKIFIGRQTEGISLLDLSVSKYHAYFKKIGKKFFIFDENSKFGTYY